MPLSPLILAKVREQAERLENLLAVTPAEKLEWRPGPEMRSLGNLLGHLLDCLAGFCAALYAFDSRRLAHFAQLRNLPVSHNCSPEEALSRVRQYMAHIAEGIAPLTDADLERPVPTVFVPGGEPLLTLLLGNLEHLINHKHQLFLYLKLLGVPVSTRDLYHWR